MLHLECTRARRPFGNLYLNFIPHLQRLRVERIPEQAGLLLFDIFQKRIDPAVVNGIVERERLVLLP